MWMMSHVYSYFILFLSYLPLNYFQSAFSSLDYEWKNTIRDREEEYPVKFADKMVQGAIKGIFDTYDSTCFIVDTWANVK